ncbi:MAG: adenylyltransferase/cytidyltransferase family protein [Candidatus Omnitrophica bacterium]|nr:adenylyltransferase/cytidyltransferase family protein [Candidatus Omnitrophota bacterium]
MVLNKVKTVKQLKRIIVDLKQRGKRVVFTNGCFDILHSGHIKVFSQAKSKGDVLIVGLNSDKSIKKIKGNNRPILNEIVRKTILNAICYIDYIVLFDSPTPYQLIRSLRPTYLVKGGDWGSDDIVGSEFVEKIFRVKLEKGCSTTLIIKEVLSRYA